MIIDLNESQKKLLLKTLAIAWQIEDIRGNDPGPLKSLIEAVAIALKKEGREDIFFRVFEEYLKK